jgi:tripartite ATP-independent transporter DctM subunit
MQILILFCIFLVLIFLNIPVCFTLLMISAAYIFLNDIPWLVMSHVLTSSADSFVITAIPLFILTAALMEQGEVTDRIIDFCKDLVGHLPGGLAHVNIVTSVIFAGMSGSALADAGGPGMVEVRMMREGGYDDDFTVAITAASAMIGPIIPPSIPMVIYGAISRESVGKLFLGGFIPGILIAIALMIQAHFYAKKRNYPTSKRPSLKQVAYHFYKVFLALLTPVIILGGIATGFFTPTEAAAVAAVYALVNSTRFGWAIQATAMDRDAAELMGINTERIYVLVFGIGGACVGIAGGIMPTYLSVHPEVGSMFGLIAFVCVAMGGFGSIPGAFLAGLLVGVVESLAGFYIAPVFKYIAVFGLYLAVVFLRPKGIFGW